MVSGPRRSCGVSTNHRLKDHQGWPVTADAVVDHNLAYSIYFCDPYGHRLEVTTYEHDAVRNEFR